MPQIRPDPDRYFHLFHRSLGIHMTMQCPLECAHCSVSSGPKRGERVDSELLLRRLEEIGREGHVRRLSLSGGEPFLMRPLLRAIAAWAQRYGVALYINTAGHFARSRERALDWLGDIEGEITIAISADRYHLPFVDMANIRHLAEAAFEREFGVALVIRVHEGEDDAFLAELRECLGERVWRRAKLDIAPVVYAGRGASLPGAPQAAETPLEEIADTPCQVADQPVADTDGKVYACCNTEAGRRVPALVLGDLVREGLPEMTRRADGDVLLQAIRTWGPRQLARLLQADGLAGRLTGRYRDRSICNLCEDILGDPALNAHLRKRLKTGALRDELEAGRLLRRGEIFPPGPVRAETEPAR
ncbi:radical SAM protein [Marinicauda algicola]|uniref:Radical SAM protein n=1 Tax=Marinicauda algicola TaxID=2029849 RepID=A0A4S2H4Z2_9PROT|nr:radical SAM protein [Marinicauda algicola]TGY90613.1 radical SAM protein [Marinicauda algicola]